MTTLTSHVEVMQRLVPTPAGVAAAVGSVGHEPLVYSLANGQVSHTYSTWDDAQTRLTGRVYRYVTRVDANARRVTVVVTSNGANPPAPLLMSSIKTRPLL